MRPKPIKFVLIIALPLLLILCNSKSVILSPEDKERIEEFAREWNLPVMADSVHASFAKEIEFISSVQKNVIAGIKHEEIPIQHYGDVPFYYQHRKGLCYDRAVLLEKFFLHYGFPFRHLYLYFGEGGKSPPFTSLFKRGTNSHAILEVKTKRGWMAMGTNSNWIGLTKNEKILSIGELRKELRQGSLDFKQQPDLGATFWTHTGNEFAFVYGLYSRHGNFFNNSSNKLMSLFNFLPDYNLRMILYNF